METIKFQGIRRSGSNRQGVNHGTFGADQTFNTHHFYDANSCDVTQWETANIQHCNSHLHLPSFILTHPHLSNRSSFILIFILSTLSIIFTINVAVKVVVVYLNNDDDEEHLYCHLHPCLCLHYSTGSTELVAHQHQCHVHSRSNYQSHHHPPKIQPNYCHTTLHLEVYLCDVKIIIFLAKFFLIYFFDVLVQFLIMMPYPSNLYLDKLESI